MSGKNTAIIGEKSEEKMRRRGQQNSEEIERGIEVFLGKRRKKEEERRRMGSRLIFSKGFLKERFL